MHALSRAIRHGVRPLEAYCLTRRPGSTSFGRPVQIKQGNHCQAQGLRDSHEAQIRGISATRLKSAHVRAVQFTFRRQVLLRPIFRKPKATNALAKPSESRMRSGAWRHATMVTMGHIAVYRPGSTCIRCHLRRPQSDSLTEGRRSAQRRPAVRARRSQRGMPLRTRRML